MFPQDAVNPAFGGAGMLPMNPMNPLAARGRGMGMGVGMGMGMMRGRGVPTGPGMRGGLPMGAAGRGRGIIPTGPAAGAVPTGPRAALPTNVPTGPRNPGPTGAAARASAAGRTYRDKDRYGDASSTGAGGAESASLDYGTAGGADEADRSPRRSRRDSPDYGRDSARRSSRYERSRSRERSTRERSRDRDCERERDRSARDRERDREFERERERERERDRRAGTSSRTGTGSGAGGGMSDFFPDKHSRPSSRSRDDRSASPGMRIRGAKDREDDGRRSRGGTYSPSAERKSRRTQWSDDEDDGKAIDESRCAFLSASRCVPFGVS